MLRVKVNLPEVGEDAPLIQVVAEVGLLSGLHALEQLQQAKELYHEISIKW